MVVLAHGAPAEAKEKRYETRVGSNARGARDRCIPVVPLIGDSPRHGDAMTKDKVADCMERRAAEMGAADGRGAASWYVQDAFGGRVTRGADESAARVAKGIEDGDPGGQGDHAARRECRQRQLSLRKHAGA